jgi:hypothetical protein
MLSNLPALNIVSILHMFISSKRCFMGSNKPQEHCHTRFWKCRHFGPVRTLNRLVNLSLRVPA